jgi:hypothetical protein
MHRQNFSPGKPEFQSGKHGSKTSVNIIISFLGGAIDPFDG